MKTLKKIFLLLIIVAMATSCKKETGPEGPAGPAGAQGTTGTANVIYSEWIGFDILNWSGVIDEYGKATRHYYDSIPEITQNILDHGTVIVYFRCMGTPEPQPLPMIFYNLSQPVNQYMTFRLNEGLLTIVFSNLDDLLDPDTFAGTPSTNAYRYIIIPGGVTASMTSNNFKNMSYEQVCSTLNISK